MYLGQLKLGYSDGEEESRQIDFSDIYYDYNNIVDRSLEPSVYIVAGRRGTGKTVLSFYLEKNKNLFNSFINRISYKELTPANFRKENHEIKSGSLYQLFRWMFLLELSKNLINNLNSEIFQGLKEYKILKEVNEINYEFKNPHKSSLISQIINNGVKFKFGTMAIGTSLAELELNPGIQGQITNKSVTLFYDNLFELIKPLLQKANEINYRFTILIDDVDDHLSFDIESKRILNDLINAVYGFNGQIRDYHPNSKILLFLRSDIFNRIDIANKLKIIDDHTLMLNWSTRTDIHSPLLELIVRRLKVNHSTWFKEQDSTEKVISKLFPTKVFYYQHDGKRIELDAFTYILKRTHYRPRDIVRYLRFIQQDNSELREFSGFAVSRSEMKFSDWLKSDLENELAIHYNQEYIANLMGIASRLKTWRFGFQRLKKSFENKDEIPKIELEGALIVLYKFGILGQFYQNENNETELNFFYNDADIPYNNKNFFYNDFIVHQGLQTSLLKGDANKARQLFE
jgi:hypothetical protein